MTTDERINREKIQSDLNGDVHALYSSDLDKHEYLTGKET